MGTLRQCGESQISIPSATVVLVMEGRSRTEAAQSCGMDRQTLRDWVHRYNAEGLEGLKDRRSPGPAPRLSAEQQAEVAQWVRQGPKLEEHEVVRWRRIDLSRHIERVFGVKLAERSVGDLLRRLGLRRLSVRPQHPGQDAEAQAAHKKLRRAGLRRHPRGGARQARRTLVAGRGPCRPARHADARMGRTRQSATRGARPAL